MLPVDVVLLIPPPFGLGARSSPRLAALGDGGEPFRGRSKQRQLLRDLLEPRRVLRPAHRLEDRQKMGENHRQWRIVPVQLQCDPVQSSRGRGTPDRKPSQSISRA